MNIERILLIAIIIYLIISYKKNENIEKFALSDTDKNEMITLIRPVVKEIYNTDMEAVRQLAIMANKLNNASGLEIPGNLTVTGNINSSGTFTGIGTAPIGSIIMWAGNRVTLPSNWKFCDGNTHNGITTPNLVGKFILGANAHQDGATITSDTFNSRAYNGWNLYSTIDGSYTITGGSKDAIVVSHGHGVSDPGHYHQQSSNSHGGDYGGSWYRSRRDDGYYTAPLYTESKTTGISINTEGSSGTNQNLPPYYALAYIMRIA